jgi:hypothetical protein
MTPVAPMSGEQVRLRRLAYFATPEAHRSPARGSAPAASPAEAGAYLRSILGRAAPGAGTRSGGRAGPTPPAACGTLAAAR